MSDVSLPFCVAIHLKFVTCMEIVSRRLDTFKNYLIMKLNLERLNKDLI